MRLLLQQLDKERGLKRIDEEMLISWTSDPDFSITMGKLFFSAILIIRYY